jgi:hypothetical protein
MSALLDILHPETPQSFVLAAEERFFDAQELFAKGRTTGALYLAGFVAEMLLKHACFRLRGAAVTDPVDRMFGPAMAWARRRMPRIKHEGKHSLWFWAMYVRRMRRELGRHFSEDFDQDLLRRARNLRRSWSVDLRYCEVVAPSVEVKQALVDVAWIRSNSSALWR